MKLKINNNFYISTILTTDVNDLVNCMRDRSISKAIGVKIPFPYTKNDAKNFIQKSKKLKTNFAIRNISGNLIGCISIMINKPQPHEGILGYWLFSAYRRQGIMSGAVSVFTNFCGEKFKLRKINASCYEDNVGSYSVLERNNFKLEKIVSNYYSENGRFYSAKLYGKIFK